MVVYNGTCMWYYLSDSLDFGTTVKIVAGFIPTCRVIVWLFSVFNFFVLLKCIDRCANETRESPGINFGETSSIHV